MTDNEKINAVKRFLLGGFGNISPNTITDVLALARKGAEAANRIEASPIKPTDE